MTGGQVLRTVLIVGTPAAVLLLAAIVAELRDARAWRAALCAELDQCRKLSQDLERRRLAVERRFAAHADRRGEVPPALTAVHNPARRVDIALDRPSS